jgi:serine/threonine protein kinase
MAPERLDGVSDSPSVDVYSSGMSLFELLTGRTMSLSINPITHDQAMNRQLKFISVEGMSATALEDLRGVIRRMCAYDRDHRPSAHDASRQLEQLMYAIDPSHRIPLEEFARTVVLPLYESRPRIPPEEATRATEDEEFFREVTGQFSQSSSRGNANGGSTNWVPYVFVGVLGLLLLLFGGLALQVMWSRATSPTMVDPVTAPVPSADGKVEVRIWIPSDAQAQVAGQFVPQASKLRLYEGPTLMELYFDDNSELSCEFTATEGAAVRYVGEQAISVNDGAAVACRVTREPNEAE